MIVFGQCAWFGVAVVVVVHLHWSQDEDVGCAIRILDEAPKMTFLVLILVVILQKSHKGQYQSRTND